MKLENNSLKYGINAYNGVQGAYNNAYQQEMENQRNMQNQITNRQRTLLDAATQEATYKQQERDRIYGYNPQTKTFAKIYDPSNPNAYDLAVNTTLENSTQPFRTIRDSTEQSLPVWRDIDINGNIEDARQSTLPFNAVSRGVIYHPTNVAAAKALNISPEEYAKMKYTLYSQQKGF